MKPHTYTALVLESGHVPTPEQAIGLFVAGLVLVGLMLWIISNNKT